MQTISLMQNEQVQIITYAFLTKDAHEFFPPRREAIDPSSISLAVVPKKKKNYVFQHLGYYTV